MKKTVLFYLSDLQSGGTEWFALRLARGLRGHGYAPLFLVANREGALLPLLRAEFPLLSTRPAARYAFFSLLLSLPSVLRVLRKERPLAVIGGLPLLNVILAIASLFLRNRFHFVAVEHLRLCLSGPMQRTVKGKLKHLLARFYLARADKIVCVSQTVWEDLALLNPRLQARACVLHNPVVPTNVDALRQEEAPHPWLQNKTIPVLLAIGRLLPVKDYPTLLQAFALAAQKRSLRLIILGEGVLRPALEGQIAALGLQGSVHLAGAKDNVFSFLDKTDLFVLSSTSEAFGNVVAEALACGARIVCTDCGGPREILENGKHGVLVPVGEPKALAQAIEAALEAPCDKAALSERGKQFCVEAATAAYAAMLDSLAMPRSEAK